MSVSSVLADRPPKSHAGSQGQAGDGSGEGEGVKETRSRLSSLCSMDSERKTVTMTPSSAPHRGDRREFRDLAEAKEPTTKTRREERQTEARTHQGNFLLISLHTHTRGLCVGTSSWVSVVESSALLSGDLLL